MVNPGTIVILEEDLVHVPQDELLTDVTYYSIPSVLEAATLGNRLAANTVMLGAAQAVTKVVSEGSLIESIK
jgi:Pyruvate/2-oxoacid:ferredoxin oxidoreductase gamma subunit